jgi:glycosyltransferase AglD
MKYMIDSQPYMISDSAAMKATTNYPTLTKLISSISIIIPVYNEEKRIKKCLERLSEYCKALDWDFEIIVVDDASQDNTIKITEYFQLAEDRIKIIASNCREGKGKSVQNAILRSNKEYIAYMDVDLSADPSELERLFMYIGDNDIVIGSRILRGDLESVRRPFLRSFLSYGYSLLFRSLFRTFIYDAQCGFKLLRRNPVLDILKNIKCHSYAFDTELLLMAEMQGLRIKEVPIIWEHGKDSKIKPLQQVRIMGGQLLSCWYNIHRFESKNGRRQNKSLARGRLLFILMMALTTLMQTR